MSFTFGKYLVRPVTERDRDYLTECIAKDEYHRDRFTADFFLKLKPGQDAWALEDEDGKVVFYFRTDPAVRFAIQFTESGTLASKRRNAAAMMEGLAWLVGVLRGNRFHEIITDPDSPELQVFTKRHLGFKELHGQLSLGLTSSAALEMQPEAVGTVPNSQLERVG